MNGLQGSGSNVRYNSTTGLVEVGGIPAQYQPTSWYNVKAYATAGVDIGLGVVSASSVITAGLAAITPGIQDSLGNTYDEGGVLYFPKGRYSITSTIDLASGQTLTGTRLNLTLQGDGIGATVLFSSTLKAMIAANTAVDGVTIRDMTIYTSAQFTGLGTVESVLDFVGCANVTLINVKVHATRSVARNTDCVLINFDQAFSPVLINCYTYTNLNTSTEYHNIAKSANTGIMGGTHIRSRNSNSFQMFGHRSDLAYRIVHAINDEGLSINGGHFSPHVQGILFDGCEGCVARDIRFENHPDDPEFGQYDGPDTHYVVKFDETSRYNKVIGGLNWKLRSTVPELGFFDLNGANTIEMNGKPVKGESRPLTRNGNFEMGLFTDTTVQVPGWTILGASVLTEELSDLPPEHGITRAVRIATTANARGIKTLPISIDPEKINVLLYKFWMKRDAGDHVLRPVLSSVASGSPITADLLYTMRSGGGEVMTDNLSGFVITGTPTWGGGSLTITSQTKHFLKVNQTCSLTGFTVSGTTPNGDHLVTSVTNDNTFVVAASDPGTISVVGTYGREGHEDLTNTNEWVEYKGQVEVKQYVKTATTSGLNVIFTTQYAHNVPNSGTASIKLWGFADPLWNATHTIVSTGGLGSSTFTIVRPIGAADPIDVSSGDSALRLGDGDGKAFYGWAGMVEDITFDFRSVFTTGVNTSAENLLAGFVLKALPGRMEISDEYLPGVETFVGKKTFNWPNCVAGGEQSTTVTVPGAAVGDAVTFGLSVDDAGLIRSAAVLSADTVTCVIRNPTGLDINLASGVITCTVTHAY